MPRALGEPAPVGCRLQAFLPAWAAITDDVFVLSVIRNGFTIDLVEPLPGGALRAHTHAGARQFRAGLALEISALLNKRAIERVSDHPRLCLSPVFLVPKRSGKSRMILNLRAINQYIQPVHFRMETLATILPLLRAGDWAVSIDLVDAYHHVPIAPASRRLLGFAFGGRIFRYRALPFGLRPAPRLFTRLVTVVAAFLRERGIRLYCYLDDWLVVADSPLRLAAHRDFTLTVVQSLGFIVNWEKSELTPTQRPTFLGAVIDLPAQRACPTPERIGTVMAAARALRHRQSAPARTWLRFLGYLASLVDVLPDCRLRMRPLQIHVLQAYRPHVDGLSKQIPVPEWVRPLLAQWMRRPFLAQGKHLRQRLPSMTVTTDASLLGWGAVCEGRMVSGDWSHLPYLPHINQLEFRAVMLACRHFRPLLTRQAILIQTDNITVAAYINKQGGTHSPSLNSLAAQFWNWCHAHAIVPTASYLPGQENVIADFLSRGRTLPSEWTLHPRVFAQVQTRLGPLQVDLFASSLNHQLPRYCTRARDPEAWKTDAFSFHWGGIRGYAFPPIALIPRILAKIRQDRACVVLIAPWWPRRPWFLEMRDLLAAPPWPLPHRPDLIRQPLSGTMHPNPRLLHLTAWLLSGVRVERQVCRLVRPNLSRTVTGPPPGSLTTLG